MEGGSNGTSCMMAFGENSTTNNGVVVSPMMTMMPLMSPSNSSSHTHHHHHHHHQHSHHSPNPNTDTANALMSPLFLPLPPLTTHHHHHQSHNNNNISSSSTSTYNLNMGGEISNSQDSGNNISSFKAKIMAHPHYHRLLASYLNCQKVGAPPEVVARLEAACRTVSAASGHVSRGCLGEDPALDQFMEAYCEMLCKYALELSKPFNEAMLFLQRIDSQFKSLTVSSSDSACGEGMMDRNGSSEEEVDVNNSLIDPLAEDRELKGQLLRRYSGYLGSLKQEFMKKRKKGKLPKEARQQLLDWWSRHYKWPYPSESQKVALAESTGLDQKQINNWFINQRKRHWKPSEDMQFVVMDAAAHPHHYYMDNLLGNPFPMDISSTML